MWQWVRWLLGKPDPSMWKVSRAEDLKAFAPDGVEIKPIVLPPVKPLKAERVE